MADLRSIGLGAAVTLSIAAAAVLAVGVADAIPAILASGVLGGAFAGWSSSGAVEADNKVQQGGFHGLQASGLGGAVVVGVLLALDVSATVEGAGSLLLLVASPIAIVLFALEGLGGGYLGSGLWVLRSRLGSR